MAFFPPASPAEVVVGWSSNVAVSWPSPCPATSIHVMAVNTAGVVAVVTVANAI
jgi:hypothetical protein